MPAPDTASIAADLALLQQAASEAGALALRYFGKDPQVWMKGGTSPVSEADYAVDKFLHETLRAARPDYGWLSEETADNDARLSNIRLFIVDPIDGTRGFLEGNRRWCVSIAVVENGCSIAGVLDCPATGEKFHATLGGGAWLDGKRIAARQPDDGSEIKIGGPDKYSKLLPPQWRNRLAKVSYVPSLAYRLALVASGRLDGTFVKPNARDWDLAAAALIVEEAGGAVVDASGNRPLYNRECTDHGALAAGSGPLIDAMKAVIAEDEA